MAEPNGHQDNESRLDRIERAIEHVINEHEKLIDEHRRLLTAQIVMVDSVEKASRSVDSLAGKIEAVDQRLGYRIDEIGVKLDAFIAEVHNDHREYHERLKRLEEKQ